MWSIRAERSDDVAAIAAVHREAFGTDAEARLVMLLRARAEFDPALSLVAERDGVVVGHVLFSAIDIEEGERRSAALALAPMGVRPAFQRQGCGTALVRAGLSACWDAGYGVVVVLGHAEYYPRFGFVPASRLGIRALFDVQDEAFMAVELRPGAARGCGGVVRYPPPFAAPELDPGG